MTQPMSTGLVERLEAELTREELSLYGSPGRMSGPEVFLAAKEAVRVRCAEAAAHITTLEAALKPFAAMAGAGDQRPKDDAVWAGQEGVALRYGDFRRALRALPPPPSNLDGKEA
jgi:hypothetical protein